MLLLLAAPAAALQLSPSMGLQLPAAASPEAVSNLVAALQVLTALPAAAAHLVMVTQETAAANNTPSGPAVSSNTNSRALLHASLKGAIRSAIQDPQATLLVSRVTDAAAPVSSDIEAAMAVPGLLAMQAAASHLVPGADAYGLSSAAGVSHQPLLRPTSIALAPPPYQLLPRAKGSLSSLVPVAAATQLSLPSNVLLSVKAVGINFRDVLNVLGMYPGDPGAPGSDVAGLVVQAGPDSSLQPWPGRVWPG